MTSLTPVNSQAFLGLTGAKINAKATLLGKMCNMLNVSLRKSYMSFVITIQSQHKLKSQEDSMAT